MKLRNKGKQHCSVRYSKTESIQREQFQPHNEDYELIKLFPNQDKNGNIYWSGAFNRTLAAIMRPTNNDDLPVFMIKLKPKNYISTCAQIEDTGENYNVDDVA